MLIVEGTDLVGKTTVCKKLTEALKGLGYVYSHFTRLPDEFDRYWSYVDNMSSRIVQDRFHDSELAYCHGRGDERTMTNDEYLLIDYKLRSLGAYKVLILCSSSIIEDRYREKGDDMYKLDVIVGAQKWFEANKGSFDFVVECDHNGSFTTPGEIDHILDCYSSRRQAFEAIQHRKPSWLVR